MVTFDDLKLTATMCHSENESVPIDDIFDEKTGNSKIGVAIKLLENLNFDIEWMLHKKNALEKTVEIIEKSLKNPWFVGAFMHRNGHFHCIKHLPKSGRLFLFETITHKRTAENYYLKCYERADIGPSENIMCPIVDRNSLSIAINDCVVLLIWNKQENFDNEYNDCSEQSKQKSLEPKQKNSQITFGQQNKKKNKKFFDLSNDSNRRLNKIPGLGIKSIKKLKSIVSSENSIEKIVDTLTNLSLWFLKNLKKLQKNKLRIIVKKVDILESLIIAAETRETNKTSKKI